MDTTYCDKCGLLHDPADGDCLGCELIAENKKMREALGIAHKELSLIYAEDFKDQMPQDLIDLLKELKGG